ncbi:MAG TPA: prolipoprotein diacylglyceryl transferase [Candidatus Hydrogenedens sp.]|nr:prolipoprotein diacylglyceryl transferase [Candidatus Hydrogenedens sp.]
MSPSIHILDYDIGLYNIFNFLAVCMIIILGIRWNYKYGPKYPIGISIILFVAPSAFIFGRIVYFIFFTCAGSKMEFFDLRKGGSMFIGAFSGGLLGALLYFELKEFHLLRV